MTHIQKLLHILVLFTLAVTVAFVIERAPAYVNQTFFESKQMYTEAHVVGNKVAQYYLHPLTEDHFADYLTVTEEDIETYRNHYGTLSEQLADIEAQYADKIKSSSEAVALALTAERDEKLADIQRNFEDEAYVSEKIVALKKEAVTKIIAEETAAREDYFRKFYYYDYAFYDSQTKQEATHGDVTEEAAMTYHIKEGKYDTVTRQFMMGSYNITGLRPVTYTVERSLANVSGDIIISDATMNAVNFRTEYSIFNVMQKLVYAAIASIIIVGLLALRNIRAFLRSMHNENRVYTITQTIPIDVWIVGIVATSFVVLSFTQSVAYLPGRIVVDVAYKHVSSIDILKECIWLAIICSLFIVMVYALFAVIYRLRSYASVKALWHDTAVYKFYAALRQAFMRRSIGVKVTVAMLAFVSGGFFLGMLTTPYSSNGAIVIITLLLLPMMFIIYRRIGQLNELMAYTADIVAGRTPRALSIRGKHALAQHYENVNILRQGMRDSQREQQKSERLKTELITNVSHDLRTPLTSIITYTDLLKRDDVTAEERGKYVHILETKSQRLKVLIEDLFEVSKMASGDVELYKEKIDVAQLLQQAIGEHKQSFDDAGLELRVNIAAQPIDAIIDGQKWWRLLDNLLINAYKYSLQGTRVYIHLRLEQDEVQLSIKNVSSYALNEDATELIERFKRADTARHTEGSGLGLAIAASIADLHGGSMDVQVDGDLFKVTVTVCQGP